MTLTERDDCRVCGQPLLEVKRKGHENQKAVRVTMCNNANCPQFKSRYTYRVPTCRQVNQTP